MDWSDARGATGSFPYASDPENTFEVPTAVYGEVRKEEGEHG